MIWGLGTGRCGTKSLAVEMGGVHEPEDGLGTMVAYSWLGLTGSMVQSISYRLKDRMRMDVPIVVDPRHSYVIPEIRRVDPDARFVWLYRDPVDCIRSWLARGNWTESDPLEGRFHPLGGYPEGWSRVRKGAWFWRSINGLIRQELLDNFQVIKCPQDLDVHENANTDATWASEDAVDLTKEDLRMIDRECSFVLFGLDDLRERTRGKVL